MFFINILIVIALLTVFASLVLGALNMRKTGMEARLRSNKLMRLRVAAQIVAVAALVLLVYVKSKTGT